MMKYRKKPVVIEAEQYNNGVITFFLNPALCFGCGEIDHSPHIHTMEGPLKVVDGDWIIQGVKGEFYPCKPDIFEQTYERAE